MIQYKQLVFNPLQVNCWLVFDESGDCIIFDPGCSGQKEQEELKNFVDSNKLNPLVVVATHGHFDHVPGINFVKNEFSCAFVGNSEDQFLVDFAPQQAAPFGFEFGDQPPVFDKTYGHGDKLVAGSLSLDVLHLPGHSAGSLGFYSAEGGFVIVGDVLFKGSIGRTDLPGGDYSTLISSIKSHLLVLPDDTSVLPGHGPETSIEMEKRSNPFLR
jgi:hydroxyacylglutathione hydrolase